MPWLRPLKVESIQGEIMLQPPIKALEGYLSPAHTSGGLSHQPEDVTIPSRPC